MASAVAAVAAVLVAVAVQVFTRKSAATGAEEEAAYARVIRTKTIRAGFINYPPGCIKDTATGAVKGIFVEILQKIGANLNLTVEYTEEVGWGTMIPGLDADRYDIIGSATWANPTRGKLATLSDPVYFTPIGVWVRADEARFTPENYATALNDPAVRLPAMDGSTPAAIAKASFPKAKVLSYPDLTGEPQLFLDLVAGRADAFFAEPAVAADFLRNNPGKIKNLATRHPVRTFANVYVMRKGEVQFKWMIDNAIRDLQASGFVNEVLARYETVPNAFYRVARPYLTPDGN